MSAVPSGVLPATVGDAYCNDKVYSLVSDLEGRGVGTKGIHPGAACGRADEVPVLTHVSNVLQDIFKTKNSGGTSSRACKMKSLTDFTRRIR